MRTVQMKQTLLNAWYESRRQHLCLPGGVEDGIYHVCAVVVLEGWHVVALADVSGRLCNITRAMRYLDANNLLTLTCCRS